MVVARSTGLFSLPNEILITILSHHSTLSLLTLASTCKHIHSLILRIIHHRILSASTLPSHEIILECYNPSMRLSTPHMFCSHLCTSPLLSSASASGELVEHITLSNLRDLYTTFRPLKSSRVTNPPRPPSAGGFFTPLTLLPSASDSSNASSSSSSFSSLSSQCENLVQQQIYLESHELFTQLCTNVKIVKLGPRPGVYRSCVGVGDGTLRVWRDWLSSQSCVTRDQTRHADDGGGDDAKENAGEAGVLWVDVKKDFGLRMRVDFVSEGEQAAVLVGREGEDSDVRYLLGYKDLMIRSSQLLLKVEASLEQEQKNSGKAIIIGSWM